MYAQIFAFFAAANIMRGIFAAAKNYSTYFCTSKDFRVFSTTNIKEVTGLQSPGIKLS